ncbi:MAG TPA: Yip1 family protein [Anaerolineales bacterium]
MVNIQLDPRPARRFDFARIWAAFVHPQQIFAEIASGARGVWFTPMLLLSLTTSLVVMVGGYLKSRAALMGEIALPPDWQFWTPEMQNNYMQAQQATQGPVFTYIIPLVGAITALWLGWLVMAGLLHLGSTLLGGRGSMQSALNVVAWASLPFALRDLLRVLFMLSAGHAILSPGLSGFAGGSGIWSQLLARTDIFLLWNIILLVIGFGSADGLPRSKAVAGVVVVMLIVLLAQAGLGILGSGLGGAVIQRPFF